MRLIDFPIAGAVIEREARPLSRSFACSSPIRWAIRSSRRTSSDRPTSPSRFRGVRANKVKKEERITVVMGNPPYKEKAEGRGGWIEKGSGRFEPGANATYSFSFGNVNTFDPTTYIYLEDMQQHIMYNVRNGNYQFTADSADDWNRFVLHFTPPVVINSTDATCNSLGAISITQPGAANWNYTLTDAGNAVVSSGVLNKTNPININQPAGNYTLTLVDNNNYTVTKQIQLGGAQTVTAAFSPSNTIVNTQTAVSFNNISQNANSYSWNFGDGTSSSMISPEHIYVAPGVYTVSLTATNTTGCTSTNNQIITVKNSATAINTVTENGVSLWSNNDNIYVDFTNSGTEVNAVIKIYDVLGQELSEDKFNLNGLYQKKISNIDAACVIVSVKNNDKITTKKLFITNFVK